MSLGYASLGECGRRVGEVASFLFVGGVSAMIYVSLGVVFTRFCRLPPSLAIVAALAMLVTPTYLAQRRLTFRSLRAHRAAFPRYLATQLASNGAAALLSELFAREFLARPWIAFATVAGGVAIVNFTLLKLWTFRGRA